MSENTNGISPSLLISLSLQLNGRLTCANLELLLYRICTHVHTGLPYVMEKPSEMYASPIK